MSGTRAALLVVDVQNDFCEGGALAVAGGNRIVSVLNGYIAEAAARGLTIYATRDWHPAVTSHFKLYGGKWPVHCVRDTPGAAFHPALRLPPSAIVVNKGEDPASDGYSAFDGRTADGTALLADLRQKGIEQIFVGGLTTDYCVRQSSLDALASGIEVAVLDDAIAGVDPEASERALDEIREKGARVMHGPEAVRAIRLGEAVQSHRQ